MFPDIHLAPSHTSSESFLKCPLREAFPGLLSNKYLSPVLLILACFLFSLELTPNILYIYFSCLLRPREYHQFHEGRGFGLFTIASSLPRTVPGT